MNPFFKSKFQEVLFLGITLLAFISFYIETDIYTPSFPQMVTYFGTNEDSIQLLLSMNFLGLCLSSLFFGPASDAFGRKKILCTGLSLFMISSIGCALVDTLQWMVFFRFLQGIGCGAIVSAGLTTIFDIYPPEKSSRLVSICNGTIGGMMALAPMLGNWISLHLGWRMNFYLIAFLATVTFFSTLLLTKETLPPEKRTRFHFPNVLQNYRAILTNFPFMGHTLIWCLMFSLVIVFIANLSLLFVDHLSVPKEIFGYYQAAIMSTFFIGSMTGAYLIKKWGLLATKGFGSFLYLGGIAALVCLTYIGSQSPFGLIIAMSTASLGSALAITIYFTYSMTYVADHLKGSAMSLTQCLRMLLSSGLVYLAATAFDGTTYPIALLSILCVATCLALYALLYKKNNTPNPANA